VTAAARDAWAAAASSHALARISSLWMLPPPLQPHRSDV